MPELNMFELTQSFASHWIMFLDTKGCPLFENQSRYGIDLCYTRTLVTDG